MEGSRLDFLLYRCFEVDDWAYLDVSSITEEHDVIYDSWDESKRLPIDSLEELPYQDESGAEIRIFNSRGKKISRRNAVWDSILAESNRRCGLLLNLMDIDNLYNNSPDHQDETTNQVSVRLFPQAFLRGYGHVQATGVLHSFGPAINDINTHILNLQEEDTEFMDLDACDKPLCAVSSQAYNEMWHRVAARAGDHDCQKGLITGALAGSYAKTDRGKRKAKNLLKECDVNLPYNRFKEKILDPVICRKDLRMENVYSFDMSSLPRAQRSGRSVLFCLVLIFYQGIIRDFFTVVVQPLMDAWKHPRVGESLKSHVLILKGDVGFTHISLRT